MLVSFTQFYSLFLYLVQITYKVSFVKKIFFITSFFDDFLFLPVEILFILLFRYLLKEFAFIIIYFSVRVDDYCSFYGCAFTNDCR